MNDGGRRHNGPRRMFRFPTYDPVPIDSDGIPGGGAGMGLFMSSVTRELRRRVRANQSP